jgi:hypothetical protein
LQALRCLLDLKTGKTVGGSITDPEAQTILLR